jgi:hypothetical protein
VHLLPRDDEVMMGHRERLKGGAEGDAFTSWRKVISWGKGVTKGIKRRFNRRVRRDNKQRQEEA